MQYRFYINFLQISLTIGLSMIFWACDTDSEVTTPIVDAPTVKVGEKQNIGIYPPIKPNWISDELSKKIRLDLNELMGEADFKVLETIEPVDLFAYLSGFYPEGHSFPVIYFDTKKKTFTVSTAKFQANYPLENYNQALMSFKAILVKKGFSIEGVPQSSKQYVWENGEKKVFQVNVDATDYALNSHFTEEQYTFMYNFLRPYAGFAFLSGVANTNLNYPLMYGRGGGNEAYLTIIGKGVATDIPISELDLAFRVYYEYINAIAK